MCKAKKYIEIDVFEDEICGTIFRGDGTVICRENLIARFLDCDIVKNVVSLINKLILTSLGYKFEIAGVGISCLGTVDESRGIVQAEKFGIKNLALADSVSDRVGLPVKVTDCERAKPFGEFGAVSRLF
ncbi:MAG: ROK family protein [Candidatus Coproplasma sp.]